MAMFDIIANVVLSFDNNLIIQNFSYDFDYGKENIELFKKIYAPKGIIFDENFKKIYPTFFNIKRYHSVNDSPIYFSFEFKFGKFCNYFKISSKDYYEMYKTGQNFYITCKRRELDFNFASLYFLEIDNNCFFKLLFSWDISSFAFFCKFIFCSNSLLFLITFSSSTFNF